MSGIWRDASGEREGKYLVLRRDGSVPGWPWFVISAADPAAREALLGYAEAARFAGLDPAYARDVEAMAVEFDEWRLAHHTGDPDAPRHREDDTAVVAIMGLAAAFSGAASAREVLHERLTEAFMAQPRDYSDERSPAAVRLDAETDASIALAALLGER